MSLLNWLIGAASLFAIIQGGFKIWKWRLSAIESLRKDLALHWTNEGDINSNETNFINLNIDLNHGELLGTLTSPAISETYDVHISQKWFSTEAHVSLFKGRTAWQIARVHLCLKRNPNRLHWKLCSMNSPDFIPKKTVLWPSS